MGHNRKQGSHLIGCSLLRSCVRVEPEELHGPAGLQRRRAGLCLRTRSLGIIRRAPPRCGGVLLLPLHPWVALRRRSGVRNKPFVVLTAYDDLHCFRWCFMWIRTWDYKRWRRSLRSDEWTTGGKMLAIRGRRKKKRATHFRRGWREKRVDEIEKDSSVSSWRWRKFWAGVSCRQLYPFAPLISMVIWRTIQQPERREQTDRPISRSAMGNSTLKVITSHSLITQW